MKINFKISGGFAYIPALSKPLVIDTAELDKQTADQLESAVRESEFFNQPAQPGTLRKGADYRTYTIMVEDGTQVHTIQLTDPVTDSNLKKLIAKLSNIAHHRITN